MTDERLVRSLGAAFDDLAAARTPDYLEAAIERASSGPQHPAWTFPERWLPMDITRTRVPVARLPWRQLGVLALIAMLLAAALTVYVGSRSRVPSPFGVAANGLIAYVDDQGAIQGVDPLTGESTTLVPGPDNSRPLYASDGARLAYLRFVPGAGYDLTVLDLGTGSSLVITPEPLGAVGFLGWAPDGGTIVVSLPDGRLMAYDTQTAGPPRRLAAASREVSPKPIDDFNADPRDLFRPPAGKEIVFVGSTSAGPGLFVSDADGNNARAIIDPETSAIPYSNIESPQWSTDGNRIALVLVAPDDPNARRIHIVNADGSDLRELSEDPRSRAEAQPAWSPDGTRVAFQRWYENSACGYCDTQPVTVVGVDDGIEVPVGVVNVDGYKGWSWSPDGTSILQVAQNVPERRLQIAPVDGRPPNYVGIITTVPPNWQRVAPRD